MTLDQLLLLLIDAASLPATHPVTGQPMRAGDLPVCLGIGKPAMEIAAVVADHYYVPAVERDVLYVGPFCLLTAIDPEAARAHSN